MTATTTARKSATKKASAPRVPRAVKPRPAVVEAVPDPDADADAPVLAGIVLDADKTPEQIDRFPVFALGGVQYYAPVRPSPRVGLTMLWKARHEGEEMAAGYLLEEMLGADGYQALMNYDALTDRDLGRIIALLQEAANGSAMAGPKDRLRIA